MKRHDGPISDEVSVRILTVRTMTPGAGVDPNKVIRPSKRVKAWHRATIGGASLKSWARGIASFDNHPAAPFALRWLRSKGVRP